MAKEPINTAEVLGTHDDELQTVIRDGKEAMPGFAGRLSPDDISALVEFMHSWQP